MAVTNINGHGVSSMGGHHNQQVLSANMQFMPGANYTNSMAKSNSAAGPYSAPSSAKKKFPPAL